ncbi:unnamed protein product [Closterium sp. Naga37s-1]|nr:unnamed protein product [Closterium sp. Naga37s-1]
MGKGLRSLRHLLLLECTVLTHLPPSFSGLASLETLKIVHAKRVRGALLDGFGCLKSLKELSLDSMPRLSSLPASFSGVDSLTRLDVGNCPKVTVLPEGIGRLAELEEVRIFRMGGLICLPPALFELPCLLALDVRGCGSLSGVLGDEKVLRRTARGFVTTTGSSSSSRPLLSSIQSLKFKALNVESFGPSLGYMRGVPARREEDEGEEGEGEEEEEGGDAEEEEGEEGGDVAGEREEAGGEAPEDEESGAEDDDIEHEYAMDSDYDDDIGRRWGGSDDDD